MSNQPVEAAQVKSAQGDAAMTEKPVDATIQGDAAMPSMVKKAIKERMVDERLESLRSRIRLSHEQCMASFRTSLKHARDCGSLLNEAKGLVGKRGNWKDWVKKNCPFVNVRMAQNYMQIARYYYKVIKVRRSAENLTITDCLKIIKRINDEEKGKPAKPDTDNTKLTSGRSAKANSAQNGKPAPYSDSIYRLPEGGYARKRAELDQIRSHDRLSVVEEHEKIGAFVEDTLQNLFDAVRHYAASEVGSLVGSETLDAVHIAILLVEKLRTALKIEKVFLPVEEEKVPETTQETDERDAKEKHAPVNRIEKHLNGHSVHAVIA